jgi:MFS family permease
VFPATLALVNTTFAEGRERNRALAVWGGAGAAGLVIGVLLGGVLTQALGWEAVFFVNVPLAGSALLLAFVLIAVWEQYDAARSTEDQEANELAEIYWLADRFPEAERRQVQDLAQSYARLVIDEEWPMMEDGRSSPRAWALMDQIRQSVEEFEPGTYAEQVLYDQGLSRVHDMADARRLRLLEANQYIPAILWVVLLAGGVITVTFTYLFGLENTWAHRLMVAALTVVIAFVLFTTYSLDNPFAGDIRLNPDAFEQVLHRFEENQNASGSSSSG